jgi:lipoate---protein ligase
LEANAPPFYFWQPQELALILGASQNPETEFHLDAIEREKIRVCKRRGGGGAVLLGPHCLCIAVRLPRLQLKSPLDYFAQCNGSVTQCLRLVTGIELDARGISDLSSGEKKVAGTSLYLSRNHGLYLASVLIRTPIKEMDAFLKHPSREPNYRHGRRHGEFLTDLNALGNTKTPDQLVQDFQNHWVLFPDGPFRD